MVYIEVDIKKQLPPNDQTYYTIKYNGEGSWFDGELDEFKGCQLQNDSDRVDYIKSWFKPIDITHDYYKSSESKLKLFMELHCIKDVGDSIFNNTCVVTEIVNSSILNQHFVTIKPKNSFHSIGNGCGKSITINF